MFHVPPIAMGSLLSWQEMGNVRQTCHYLARQYAMLFAQKICVNCANLSYLPSYFLNHVKTVSLRHYNIPMHMISHDHWTLELPSSVRTMNLHKTESLSRKAIPDYITNLVFEQELNITTNIDFLPPSLKKVEFKSSVVCNEVKFPNTLESLIIHQYWNVSMLPLPSSLLHLELNNSRWKGFFNLITLPPNLISLKLGRGWHINFTLPTSLKHLVIHTSFYADPWFNELIAFPSLLESLEICNVKCTKCVESAPLPTLPSTLQFLYIAGRLRCPFVNLPQNLTHLTVTNHVFEEPLFHLPPSLRYLFLGYATTYSYGFPSEMIRLPPFLHTFHFQTTNSFSHPTLRLEVPNTLRFLTIPKNLIVPPISKGRHPHLEVKYI